MRIFSGLGHDLFEVGSIGGTTEVTQQVTAGDIVRQKVFSSYSLFMIQGNDFVDTPKPVRFGDTDEQNGITLTDLGIITMAESGLYEFVFTICLDGQGGGGKLIYRAFKNDDPISHPYPNMLDAGERQVKELDILCDVNPGDEIKLEILRSADGANQGRLQYIDTGHGEWGRLHSANLDIYRLTNSSG